MRPGKINAVVDPAVSRGATAPTESQNNRLAVLLSQLVDCQTAGITVRWMKSRTKPPRILLAIYRATICPKCGAFVLIGEAGTIKCQTPGCEWNGVEYTPDE